MTPLEKIIKCMDPKYELIVRRAMARGILGQYNDELIERIDEVGLPNGAVDEFDAGLIAAIDLIRNHAPKEG